MNALPSEKQVFFIYLVNMKYKRAISFSIHAGEQTFCNLTPAGDTDSLAFNSNCGGEMSDKGKVKTAKEYPSLLMTFT